MKKVAIGIEINNNAGRGVLGGILKYISGRGDWNIKLMSYPETMSAAVIRDAKANGFNGILVNHVGDTATALELARTPLPLSAVDIHDKGVRRRKKRTAFVGNRNREIGALGAKKLLSLGQFRNFVFVGHPARPVWSEDRRDGFCDELARHGLTATTLLHDDIRQALTALPRPLAVMTAWDYKAIEVLENCREIGLDVPSDIAVIGVDADPLVCGFTTPPLTSVAPNFERIGYCAAAALDAMMNGHKTGSVNFIDCKPLDVVERASTKFLPPVEALLKHALDIIQRDAIRGLSVRDLAMRLGVSQQLLALRFRQYEQKSVRDLILDTRLEHVKELLKHTHRDFAAVAKESGFNSANRLAHLFKEKIGLSLGEYARLQERRNDRKKSARATATERKIVSA